MFLHLNVSTLFFFLAHYVFILLPSSVLLKQSFYNLAWFYGLLWGLHVYFSFIFSCSFLSEFPSYLTLSPLSPQSGSSGIPASAAGRPGGERFNGDSGEPGGDMAGGVSTHPHPDQWGADPHPSSTAGPGRYRATRHGEKWSVIWGFCGALRICWSFSFKKITLTKASTWVAKWACMKGFSLHKPVCKNVLKDATLWVVSINLQNIMASFNWWSETYHDPWQHLMLLGNDNDFKLANVLDKCSLHAENSQTGCCLLLQS